MIIVDTNVLSALMGPARADPVIAWLDRQPSGSTWTTAITIYEVEYGLRRLPKGKRRTGLAREFAALLDQEFGRRVLSFDSAAARAAAALSATLASEGTPVEVRDVQIAGIALARRATVATRNVKHFERACPVINPWEVA